MKKILACAFLLLSSVVCVFAGDAAAFCDIGFSEDGKVYIFGQYGKTDKDYQAWAEIYTVDVAKNDFIKNDVFKTLPSASTSSISGKDAFDRLYSNVEWKLAKYNCKTVDVSTLLYVKNDESKKSTDEIVFKDYDGLMGSGSIFYHVTLVPTYRGKDKNCKSSFYINVETKDEDGKVLSCIKVGTPSVKRDGITSYTIEKIFTDKSGRDLVFVIQKILEDDNGISIRYMVETAELK